MSIRRLLNNAAATRNVHTITIAGTWVAADTITITIGGVALVITVGSLVTVTQIAVTVVQAILGTTFTDTTAVVAPANGGQTLPMFTEFTATSALGVVTLTASTTGKPFTVTTTKSSTSGTVADAETIAATGPLFFSNAVNFSGATVPVDNDTITIDSGNVGLTYGLTTSIQPLVYNQTQGFTGDIGLAQINLDSRQNSYAEYRTPQYLTFDDNSATCVYTIGEGQGAGSQRTKIDAGAGQGTFVIIASGQRELQNVPAILLKGTHTSNSLTVRDGDVGVAFYDGETSTFATINMGSGINSQGRLVCGTGTTLSSCTIAMIGGTLETNSAISVVNIYGGEWTHQNGNVATLNAFGGKVIWKANSATITTLAVGSSGTFDKSQDARPLTVTNVVKIYKGATLRDPYKTITFSAGIQLVDCTLDDVTLDVGPNRTVTVS